MIVNYVNLYDSMVITRPKEAQQAVARILENYDKYKEVENQTGVPWQFVAVVHYREDSSLGFKRHIHNGDLLTARTKRKPPGRPAKGNPPFTWEESAADWVSYMKYDKVTDWSIPEMLRLLERNNGPGYKNKKMLTPYLWSGSNHYTKGKFVADGVFNPNTVDKQLGAAVLLKHLL